MKAKLVFMKCEKCGHRWIPRTKDVRQCAKCKTAFFDVPRETFVYTPPKTLQEIEE